MSRRSNPIESPQPQAGQPLPARRRTILRWAVRATLVLGLLAAGWLPVSCDSAEDVISSFTDPLNFSVFNLSGTGMVVQNNGGDDVTVNADGNYTFPTELAQGVAYDVTVATQPSPAGETCTGLNGSGNMPVSGADPFINCLPTPGILIGSFGTNGVVIFDNGGTADVGNALIHVTEGGIDHIYVTGASGGSADDNGDMAVWAMYNYSTNLGLIDTNFNSDGLATFANPTNPTGGDVGRGIAYGNYNNLTQRLMIAGYAQSNSGAPTEKNGAFWVLTANTGGAVASNTYVDVPDSGQDQEFFALNLTTPSPIIAGRARRTGGSPYDFMTVWRMGTTSPTLDSTGWAPNGYVSYDGGFGDDIALAIDFDESGSADLNKLFVAGVHRRSSTPTDFEMGLWRMHLDTGALDSTFDSGGRVSDPGGASTNVAAGNAVAVFAPIGTTTTRRIYVAGYTMASGGDKDLAVWCYKFDGTLDTNFGGVGYVTLDGSAGAPGTDDEGLGITVDGGIYVTGGSVNADGDWDMVVWNFNDDGTLNTGFGTNGVAVFDGTAGNTTAGTKHDVGNAIIFASPTGATLQILVTGASTNVAGNLDMVVWALNP